MPDLVESLMLVYRSSVPPDITADDIGDSIKETVATMLATVAEESQRLIDGSRLRTAVGAFLDLHAQDRGLRRQEDETDDQLRERLRTPPRAGTVSSIIEAVTQVIDGDDNDVILIELPRQGAFFTRESFFDRHHRGRMGGGRGVVIVLIPASADALESVMDVVRTKVSGGKIWFVQEYTT